MVDLSPDVIARFRSLPKGERKTLSALAIEKMRANPAAATKVVAHVEKFLERPKSAVCPIFRMRSPEPSEQFGSGVLIDIAGVKFLCTAAHVADDSSKFPILVPGKTCLIQLTGLVAGTRMPISGSRKKDDCYDIAYFRLDAECANNLHRELSFLERQDCDLHDTTLEGDAYTIIGFPALKSKTAAGTARTWVRYLTGEGVADKRYAESQRNIQHHLLVQWRRKRALSYRTMNRTLFCSPMGMSGGGVFAWSKKLPAPNELAQPKLVGIVTDYDLSLNVFIATRLNCFISAIRKNNPDLPIPIAPRFRHDVRPH